jgi:hypothetical protein
LAGERFPETFWFGFLMISSKLALQNRVLSPNGSDFRERAVFGEQNSLDPATSSRSGYFRCGGFVDFVPQTIYEVSSYCLTQE